MILVTGGAGYIGSHTVVELISAGYDVVIADNLCNSKLEVIPRLEEITGRKLPFIQADMCNESETEAIFRDYPIDTVIHFAGLKAVGESTQIPLEYYRVNIGSAVNVLQVMARHNVKNFVFSSSATVYGGPHFTGIKESTPYHVTNPYGRTKRMIEEILTDACAADPELNVVLLRYFNPIGAHKSGRIGEDPNGIPNNLVPYIAQVAVGRRAFLNVYGNDYNTPDGTGVRDYIHVVDLAKGHVAALKKLAEHCGLKAYNLGTGKGSSVMDVLHAFERACGRELPYKIQPRRPGDIDMCFADSGLALAELGWKTEYDLDDMCRDSWNWQQQNPNGY